MDASTIAPQLTSPISLPRRHLRSALLPACTAILWLIALMDWTVRDSIPYVAAIFYASPPVVLGVCAFCLAGIGRTRITIESPLRIQRWINRATAILGIVCLLQWGIGSFRTNSAQELPPDACKLVFWNIGYGQFARRERVAEEALGFQAEVLAFAETIAGSEAARVFWETNMPGYTAYPLKSGLMLLVKGRAEEKGTGPLGVSGEYRHLAVEVRNTCFDILMADLKSDPFRSRKEPLAELFQRMQDQSNIPTVVLGDFNTPPTSVWFDRWRVDWARAWEASGTGYEATWPQPLPVLSLDHVWGNQLIVFHHCQNGWSRCSNHRPVIVTLTVNAASKPRLTGSMSPPKIPVGE